jgi:hypothetical protein
MKTIGTKQQNRGKRAAAVLFDDQTQRIQNVLERHAGSDHLENTLLTREQCFAPLTFGHVIASFKNGEEITGFAHNAFQIPRGVLLAIKPVTA